VRKSILAHIASNFISEYENVANSSICYLLNEYPAAQKALKNILDIGEVPSYYKTEMSSPSNGRPDVTGIDANGDKTIIIEGKFWANLTENQPGSYLNVLEGNGRILFLAPAKRLASLELEIEERLGGKHEKVVCRSWMDFLDQVGKENNKDHSNHLDSDLIQVKELCQKMDTEGMPPLSQSDLDPMNGRVASHFPDIVDECNSNLRKWDGSDFKGMMTTSHKYGHGFYFRGHNFQCYFGYNSFNWFTKNSHTPFWLYINDKEGNESEKINHALSVIDPANSYGKEYGIMLQTGMDKSQVVNHIVSNVIEVLDDLKSKLANE
jgi:hypothetical protein